MDDINLSIPALLVYCLIILAIGAYPIPTLLILGFGIAAYGGTN